MKNVIVCKKWDWLWIALFTSILLGGIGFMLQIFQPIDDFEKAFTFVIGIFMATGGGFGVLYNLFGEKKAEEIGNWIYGSIMALAGIAFFGTLIVGGIVGLIKVIF